MPELTRYQKILFAKARDAKVTLPKDSETANLSKSEFERLSAALDRGEDVFSSSESILRRPGGSGGQRTALRDDLDDLIRVLKRISDHLEEAS